MRSAGNVAEQVLGYGFSVGGVDSLQIVIGLLLGNFSIAIGINFLELGNSRGSDS